ncbi:hypothetical protein H696_06042 [Fonticula alba]|uniref:Proteasome subunit alpha type n=1 Tax=Fonticula alba TaxID=691883 RepID=A0A058Z0U5_FONAL|nr:hypothetical protein H696_06042 [Fonticula alba]KCV67523.1 hypothetical protein H696_06042 [Fonticula alba]|eukprot:XP_009498084.1 hypothetical protein H696_06042 [Fonticula alba]
MSRGSSAGYDRHITIFSPEGRLYQVEYAFKAITSAAPLTALAVTSNSCAVLVSQRKIPERFVDPTSVSHIHSVSRGVGCITLGRTGDCVAQLARMREEAAHSEYKLGMPMGADVLAQRMASLAQVYTQQAYMRPLAVATLLVAADDERGPLVFRVDPAGHAVGFRAVAIGQRAQEAMSALEKRYKATRTTTLADAGDGDIDPADAIDASTIANMDVNATIDLALSVLQQVLGMDLTTEDFEVGVAEVGDNIPFRKLDCSEREEAIRRIQEAD